MIVSGRDAALKQISFLIKQLNDISELTSTIDGRTAEEGAMQQGNCYRGIIILIVLAGLERRTSSTIRLVTIVGVTA